MRIILIALSLLLVIGLGIFVYFNFKFSKRMGPKEGRESIWMYEIVEYYYGKDSENVPLGKCVATAFPQIVRDRPASLSLLQEALHKPLKLTPYNDIIIIITPKELLTEYDFIKPNKYSKWENSVAHLSFDFIKYKGETLTKPRPMSCVIEFNLGRLKPGKYRASVMNSYLEYSQEGKESEAKVVPKSRIHPPTFWHEIEFTICKDGGKS